MLKPYSIIEETSDATTYEFKTIYLWLLYGIAGVGGVGLFLKQPVVTFVAGACLLVYFLTVSLQYRKLGALARNAARNGSVTYSGSKWSFTDPLRLTIPGNRGE